MVFLLVLNEFYSQYNFNAINLNLLFSMVQVLQEKMKSNVSFVANSKGKVKDAFVQKFNHRLFAISVMEIIENIPDFNPADFKGKKGDVHYVLKFVFE